MLDDFFWRAWLGGMGVTLIAGPLGCFVVWRRMSYFGDTLAHSALLGVVLGILAGLNTTLSIISTCIVMALLLNLLQHQQKLATDTLLGILSHSALSVGLVVLAFIDGFRIDLYSYLFGDLLAVNKMDLYWIYGGGILVLLGLWALWQPLLSITVHEDLSRVDGIPVRRVQVLFTLLIAVTIAIAMKIVGILLITSLLIIPAATARTLARTPVQMAIMAAICGAISVSLGLWGSMQWDTPTGPSVVVAASSLFVLTLLLPGNLLQSA